MKILLLSDIPPCENLTAGLVLSALVRLIPRGQVCCFTVANPLLDIKLAPEFSNIPLEFHPKPNENWKWLPRNVFLRRISSAVGFVGESIIERTTVQSLIQKAVVFGQREKVTAVWAVLQGQTTIRMAKPVAQRLGVPLYTHVWDPFSWWAKANLLDGVTTRRVQAAFDDALRSSRCIAVASEPMAETYSSRFGVPAVPVIASHPGSMQQRPDTTLGDISPITIGMAGQFYASEEWLQLLRAMRSCGWSICGRPVRILAMGPQAPPGANDPNIGFLGWKSQPDAASALSQCDVLYCPYPFNPQMEEVCRLSFPSKLVLYLAAGRPILFHGPEYSSPVQYIQTRKCGLIADRLFATAVYNELERMFGDASLYRELASNAQSAFIQDFTLESMAKSFNMFVGSDAQWKNMESTLHNHTNADLQDRWVSGGVSASQRIRSLPVVASLLARNIRRSYELVRIAYRKLRRRAGLGVPRIRALYDEVHLLCAEVKSLRSQLDSLERQCSCKCDSPLDRPAGGTASYGRGQLASKSKHLVADSNGADLPPSSV